MLRLHQIRLTLSQAAQGEPDCRALAAAFLIVAAADVLSAAVFRRRVDARDKRDVQVSLSLDVALFSPKAEQALIRRFQPNQAVLIDAPDERDVFSMPAAPYGTGRPRPVVIGAGPAGLFCALGLAVRGAKPIVLERGKRVDERTKDVTALMRDGVLNPESNVLFGEGGAGAYSDGKLTCGLKDPLIRTVLNTLAACGAPPEILIDAKPHIGTDFLRWVLKTLRGKLLTLGAELLFERRATGLAIANGRVTAVLAGDERFGTDTVFLAAGHSARDVYAWLDAAGVPLQSKPFAVGVRIEHPQVMIDQAQYGGAAGHPALPPAEYKLNVKTPDSRGVYTFCMCPGGEVMNASSEPGRLNLNGMSRNARDGRNANAALLVGVHPSDFGGPLDGIAFQRKIEEAAFAVGGGYLAPCQRVEDFLRGRPSQTFGVVQPSYRPGVVPGDIARVLPDFVTGNLRRALPILGKRLAGFDLPDALLTAPETRSSSPVRILRDGRRESPVRGLYPLGEGAGYTGGIISSAVDGLKAALDERTL
ncbi:MAG: FAD-dependent protein [Bacillota bacterium]